MGKNIPKTSSKHSETKTEFKKKDKHAAKLKNKLKAAIFNKKNPVTETILNEAKSQKTQTKFNIPATSASNDSKPKNISNGINPSKKKKKHSNKNEKNVEEVSQNDGQVRFNATSKTKVVSNDLSTSVQAKKNATKIVNGHDDTDKLSKKDKKMKQKKKKKKQKKKLNEAAAAGPSTGMIALNITA